MTGSTKNVAVAIPVVSAIQNFDDAADIESIANVEEPQTHRAR
jgi:hypothetical protein